MLKFANVNEIKVSKIRLKWKENILNARKYEENLFVI